MKIIQVRNATQLISYAGKKFLVDPMLAKKKPIRDRRNGPVRYPHPDD